MALVQEGGPTKTVKREALVLVCPYYGSDRLLPAFLDHHRRLGVDLFVFLDLSAEGGLLKHLPDQSDCAVWRPRGSANLERVICWLNFLRWRYAKGRWCLSIEPSEFFVFTHSESREIKDLIAFMEGERRFHIYAIVVEMYGESPAAALRLDADEHPLTKLPYFDPSGYLTSAGGRFRNVLVRGGMQRRTMFADRPGRSPALNRTPLVKWRWFYTYVAGTRLLTLPRLNTPHAPWHTSPTACLLRFALLEADSSLALAAKAEAAELVADGGGLSYPALSELRNKSLLHGASSRFNTSADLLHCGLLNAGQWF